MADSISWHGTKTALETAENYGLVSAEADPTSRASPQLSAAFSGEFLGITATGLKFSASRNDLPRVLAGL